MTDITSGLNYECSDLFFPEVSRHPVTILRCDIHHFFDNVNKQRMYHVLFENNVFSRDEEILLKNILFDRDIQGLPQGNPISSVLTEIYLNDFDSFIELNFTQVLYERFVDDFILIFPEIKECRNTLNNIESKLHELGLELSLPKTSIVVFDPYKIDYAKDQFDFLGYNFATKRQMVPRRDLNNKNIKKYLTVDISDSKFKKYKSKINKYFFDYRKSSKSISDFWKLRIKLENIFLGIITLDKSGGEIRIGLPYGYSEINMFERIRKLARIVCYLCYRDGISKKRQRIIFTIVSGYEKKNPQRVLNYLTMSRKTLVNRLVSLTAANPKVYHRFDKDDLIRMIFSEAYR